jgi:hypothetical protein
MDSITRRFQKRVGAILVNAVVPALGYLIAPGLNKSDRSVAIAAPPNHG